MTTRAHRVSVLSDGETARALAMIDAVARHGTPITIARTHPLAGRDVDRLRRELVDLLAWCDEPGLSAYLRPAPDHRWAYGFFRFPWALRALHFLDVERGLEALGPFHAEWVQGLLFGNDAAAIARHLQAQLPHASSSLAPTRRPAPAGAGTRLAAAREGSGGTPSPLNRIDGILASRAPHVGTDRGARRRSTTHRRHGRPTARPES